MICGEVKQTMGYFENWISIYLCVNEHSALMNCFDSLNVHKNISRSRWEKNQVRFTRWQCWINFTRRIISQAVVSLQGLENRKKNSTCVGFLYSYMSKMLTIILVISFPIQLVCYHGYEIYSDGWNISRNQTRQNYMKMIMEIIYLAKFEFISFQERLINK